MVTYKLRPLNVLRTIVNLEGKDIEENTNTFVTNNIAVIDEFMSQFNDSKEAIEELRKYFEIQGGLYIYYENGGPRASRVLYGSDKYFTPYIDDVKKREFKATVSTETKQFKSDFEKLLKSASNSRYMKFLYDNNFISEYLYTRLLQYADVMGTYSNDDFDHKKVLVEKIKANVSNYKQLRDLYVGTRIYEKVYHLNKDRVNASSFKDDDISDLRDYMYPSIVVSDEELKEASVHEEPIYLDEQEQDLYDAYMHGGEEELMLYTDFVPENVRKKIMYQEKFDSMPNKRR